MIVIVNGRETEVPHGSSVADLLERLGLRERPVAVERNRRVVRKDQRAGTVLCEGDRIEIVTLVGGG